MPQSLSIVIITWNEESNLARTLASVAELVHESNGEIVIVDSGSTDRTLKVAQAYGANIFVEEWKGFAAQKNSAIAKASCDWILSLDADEEIEAGLAEQIRAVLHGDWTKIAGQDNSFLAGKNLNGNFSPAEQQVKSGEIPEVYGFWLARKNFFLGRWIKHGGFYPDRKLRLFRRGYGSFEDRPVHETVKTTGPTYKLGGGALLHYAYPTLQSYIGHMNKYSLLGAEMAADESRHSLFLWNIILRPGATFIYNYFFRRGFLDGREGLLLHMYHAVYVSWKYAKAWEMEKETPPQRH